MDSLALYSSSGLRDMLDGAKRKRRAKGKKRRMPKRDPLTGLFVKAGVKKRGRKRKPGRPKGSKTKRHHADMALLDLAMHHDEAKRRGRRRKKKSCEDSIASACPPELRKGFVKICKIAAEQARKQKALDEQRKEVAALTKAVQAAAGVASAQSIGIGFSGFKSVYGARKRRRRSSTRRRRMY